MFRVIALFLLCCGVAPAQDDAFGVWWRGGPDAAAIKKNNPWIKGVFVALRWADLEKSDGQYDWKYFDDNFARYANAGLYIQFMMWVGPDSPRWIYSAGVPEVKTTPALNPHGVPHKWTYPFYLHPKYKEFYFRMLRQVSAHIDSLPAKVRNRIICVQTAEGTTGDEGGYKGEPLDARYELPEDKWRAFKFDTWQLMDDLYRPKSPRIHILTNSGNNGQYHEYLLKHFPDWWRKAGNPGHGFQLNNEKMMQAFFDPLINHPENGVLIRARSEMDEMFKGWFQEAPVWNQYWLNLWGLHFGLDIFQHETQAFTDPKYAEGFKFYARYGGQKDASKSPGAFCALHDGLDAANFDRFPKEKFGDGELRGSAEAMKAGLARTLRIAQAFAAYGAVQGDPEKGMKVVMQNRDAKKMNDVGWNIEADNYQRYLRQWNPNGTSQGYWRVGPKDQPYGRFARGFDAKSGKNRMQFALDKRFYQAMGPRTAKLRVIYFDAGTGSWELRYDSTSGEKKAMAVKNGNTGRWKQIEVEVRDGLFAHRLLHDCDLALVNTSGENTIFHMVEFLRDFGSY